MEGISELRELILPLVRRAARAIAGVSVTATGVHIRTGSGLTQVIPLHQVDRFDWEGDFCVLLLRDGKAVRVRAITEDRRGDVTALNNQLISVGHGHA